MPFQGVGAWVMADCPMRCPSLLPVTPLGSVQGGDPNACAPTGLNGKAKGTALVAASPPTPKPQRSENIRSGSGEYRRAFQGRPRMACLRPNGAKWKSEGQRPGSSVSASPQAPTGRHHHRRRRIDSTVDFRFSGATMPCAPTGPNGEAKGIALVIASPPTPKPQRGDIGCD